MQRRPENFQEHEGDSDTKVGTLGKIPKKLNKEYGYWKSEKGLRQ